MYITASGNYVLEHFDKVRPTKRHMILVSESFTLEWFAANNYYGEVDKLTKKIFLKWYKYHDFEK
jgi:hypothetical protein